jgi:hypothetical protein
VRAARRARVPPPVSRALLAAVCLTAFGCASVPLAPRPTGVEEALLAAAGHAPKRAALVGCAPPPPAGYEPCVVITRRVTELLQDTGLFSRVGTSVSDADVTVQIHPVDGTGVEDAPPSNPGYLVLSAFVPLWWSDTYGYRLTVRERGGREIEVDTTHDGTEVMWGLAALLNIAPDRGFMPDLEREAAQVGVQLLPLWPEAVAGDPATAGGTE